MAPELATKHQADTPFSHAPTISARRAIAESQSFEEYCAHLHEIPEERFRVRGAIRTELANVTKAKEINIDSWDDFTDLFKPSAQRVLFSKNY